MGRGPSRRAIVRARKNAHGGVRRGFIEALEQRTLLDGQPLSADMPDLLPHLLPGALVGRVYEDVNGNGDADPGEPGLNDWSIDIVDRASGQAIATLTTSNMDVDGDGQIGSAAEAGWYRVEELPAGVYWVRVRGEAGYAQTGPLSTTLARAARVTTAEKPGHVTAADVDGDGRSELVVSHFGQGISILKRDEEGGYSVDGRVTVDCRGSLLAGDFDGDEDIDLIVESGKGRLTLLSNDGGGGYVNTRSFQASSEYLYSMGACDVDGDGDADIVASWYGGMAVLANNGSGVFAIIQSKTLYGTGFEQAFGDLDGDGDADLSIGGTGYYRYVLLNDGTGRFAEPVQLRADDSGAGYVAIGDVDNDGDLDLVSPMEDTYGHDGLEVWLNDGHGNFSTPLIAAMPPNSMSSGYEYTRLVDINLNGFLDVVVASNTTNQAYVLLGQGDGRFDVPIGLGANGDYVRGIAVDDLDDDGDKDLALSYWNSGAVAIHENDGGDGHGGYAVRLNADSRCGPYEFGFARPGTISGQIFADTDLDGDCGPEEHGLNDWIVELVDRNTGEIVAVAVTGPSDLDGDGQVNPAEEWGRYSFEALPGGYELRSVGRHGYRQTSPEMAALAVPRLVNTGMESHYTYDSEHRGQAASGDFNADGCEDLAVTHVWAGARYVWIYLSAGGSLGEPVAYETSTLNDGVVPGDFDGDGDLDLALMQPMDAQVSLLLNDGIGRFEPGATTRGVYQADFMLAGDVDGDGDLDLVDASGAQKKVRVLLNRGDATFSTPAELVLSAAPLGIALADGDNDGDLDLVAAFSSPTSHLRLYQNDGEGAFVAGPSASLAAAPLCLAAGDFDLDGHVDLAVGLQDTSLAVLNHLGNWTFAASSLPVASARSVLLDDIDGDGQIDVAATDGGSFYLWVGGEAGFNPNSVVRVTAPEWADTDAQNLFSIDLDGDGWRDVGASLPDSDLVALSRFTASHSVTLASGGAVADVGFAAQAGISVEGRAYEDANGNGGFDAGEMPLAGCTIRVDIEGVDASFGRTFASDDVPAQITPAAAVARSSIFVGNAPGVIESVSVRIDVTHARDAELAAWLVSPQGIRMKLFEAVGGEGADFSSTMFSDAASTAIEAGQAPFVGAFRPAEPLSALAGLSAQGTWTLELVDSNASSNFGALTEWSLELMLAEPVAVTDAAGGYSFSLLPQGTYRLVSETPPGMAPAAPASAAQTVRVGAQPAVADFGFRRIPPPSSMHLSVVTMPTSLGATGECANIPESAYWLHEWQPFYVEIYVHGPIEGQAVAIRNAAAALEYDSSLFSAVELEYGPGFAGTIASLDDSSGRVSGISATAVGDSDGAAQYSLLARVRFEPLGADQVVMNAARHFGGPYSLSLAVSQANVQLEGYAPASPQVTTSPGTEIWAMPFDADDNQVIDLADFEVFRATMLEPVAQGGSGSGWWADLDKSGRGDFGDFSYFVPNFGKSRGNQILLPPGFPYAWGGPALTARLVADTAPGGMTNSDGVTSFPVIEGLALADGGLHNVTARLFGPQGGGQAASIAERVGPAGRFELDLPALAAVYGQVLSDGAYELVLEACDHLGNAVDERLLFTLDRTAPAPPPAPVLAPASDSGREDSDGITANTRPSILLPEAADAQAITILLSGAPIASGQPGTLAALATLADGEYWLTAVAIDVAGNVSGESSPLKLVIDTRRPTVAAWLTEDSGVDATDDLTRVAGLSGAASDNRVGLMLELALNGSSQWRDFTALALADGRFTLGAEQLEQFSMFGLEEGEHTWQVRATDAAGNTSEIAAGAFTLDSTAPASPTVALDTASDSGAPGDWATIFPTVALTGQAEAGATVELVGGSGATRADAAGIYRLENIALALGDQQLVVRVTDLAGNTAQTTVAVDREAGGLVTFADPDLAAAVRTALLLPVDHVITEADLLGLTTLDACGDAIEDLEGLQGATNLQTLSIASSQLAGGPRLGGLSVLAALPRLKDLSLVGEGLIDADLAAVVAASSLTALDMRYNALVGLAPLAAMPMLESVQVYGNPLADPAGLAGMAIMLDLPPAGLEQASSAAAMADALHRMPLAIYEHVVNTFAYEPYYGFMKPVQSVVETGGGNAWDLSRLLADMLERCGVSTRFVSGLVRGSVSEVQNWLGVDDPTSASLALRLAGSESNTNTVYEFEHTWLEARLMLPGGGESWIALDPSWKLREYQGGLDDVAAQVPFDEVGYFSEVRTDLAWEYYRDAVEQHLTTSHPGSGMAAVPYRGPIRPMRISLANLALPYRVEQSWVLGGYGDLASWAHRIHIDLRLGQQSLFTRTLILPEVADQTVQITYADAGADLVTPELRVADEVIATGQAIAADASLSLIVEHLDPGDDVVDRAHVYERPAGQVLALGIDANQIGSALMERLYAKVNEAQLATANGQIGAGAAGTADFLSLAAAKYLQAVNADEDALAAVTSAVPVRRQAESGLASGATAVIGNQTLAFPQVPGQGNVDMGGLVETRMIGIRAHARSDQANALRSRIAALNGSAHEHAVWEELANAPAISTIKSLQLAHERAIPVLVIDAANAGAMLPQLTIAEATKQNIGRLVLDEGATVTVPRDPTPYGSWQGVGYMVEKPGSCAFMISGGLAGQTSLSGGSLAEQFCNMNLQQLIEFNDWYAGDPVNVGNGVLTHDETDFALPNIGPDLGFARHYDTQLTHDFGMGSGWTYSYCDHLFFGLGGQVIWVDSQGYQRTFTPAGSVFQSPAGTFGALEHPGDEYVFRETDGTTRCFDVDGRLTRIADRHGNELLLGYVDGLLAFVADGGNPTRRLQFTFDTAGRLTTISDFAGREWVFGYANGLLTRVTRPSNEDTLPSHVEYEYYSDAARSGLLKSVTAADGGITRYEYYANRWAFRVTDAEGYAQWLAYDPFRHRTDFINERGFVTEHALDAAGNLAAITHADGGRSHSVWSEQRLLLSRGEPDGRTTIWEYDDRGNVTLQTDPGGLTTETQWHAEWSLPTVVIERGLRTEYTYDARGNAIRIVGPGGGVTEQTFDARGLPLSITQPNGNETLVAGDYTTTFAYNAAGQIRSATNDLPSVQEFSYDASGNLIAYTDPLGLIHRYEYDLLGRELRYIDPADQISQTLRDSSGRVGARIDALGRSTQYTYDLRGMTISEVRADGSRTESSYDAARNRVFHADELGNRTEWVYDAADHQAAVIAVDGGIHLKCFDGGGRVIVEIDPRGAKTQFIYDEAGRLTELIDPLGNVRRYEYLDGTSRVSLERLPNDGVNRFEYDLAGRLTAFIDAEAHRTEYRYDANGNRIRTIDARGNSWVCEYDVMDRLVRESDPLSNAVTYELDASGNLLSQTDGEGNRTRREYDGLERVRYSWDAVGNRTSYEYDAVGNLLSETDPLGRTTRYAHDARDRLVTYTDATGGVQSTRYDAAGRTVAELDALGCQTRYGYDAVGRNTWCTDALGATTQWRYDAAGNLTRVIDPLGRTTYYSYDAAGQRTFAADPADGVTRMTYDGQCHRRHRCRLQHNSYALRLRRATDRNRRSAWRRHVHRLRRRR